MLELAAAKAASTSAWDEPGTIAFLVIVGMAIALYFIFRSLSRHLRKINEAAREEAAQADAQRSSGSGGGTRPGDTDPGASQDSWSGNDYERQQSEQDAALMDFER